MTSAADPASGRAAPETPRARAAFGFSADGDFHRTPERIAVRAERLR